MCFKFITLATLLLLPAAGFAQTLSETTLPDGRVVRAETAPAADGAAQRHGNFKVFPEGSDKWLISGEYQNGVREGKWVYRYNSGDKLASGKYRAGVRSGRWKFYWQSGDLSCEGLFKKGDPKGKWIFYDVVGGKPSGAPIEIARVVGTSPLDQCSYSGLLGNGGPIGWWKIVRTDGSTLFEGAFSHEGRLRSCLYRHAGGVADPVFFAERRDALHPEDFAFQSIDEYGTITMAGGFPEMEVEPGLASAMAFVKADPALSEVEPVPLSPLKAKTKVSVYSPGVWVRDLRFKDPEQLWTELAAALKTASSIDWSDIKGRTSAVELFQDVIVPGLGFPDLGIDFLSKSAVPDQSHLALLRIHSMLSMRRNDEDFWTIDAQLGTTAPLEQQAVPVIRRINPTLWLSAGDLKTLEGERKKAQQFRAKAQASASRRGPKGASAAIEKGLDWLMAEQREDGSWPSGTSSHSEDPKTLDRKIRGYDVGVTGLAVLALLRDPMTRWRDDRMTAIRKGCAFILSSRVGSRGYFATLVEYVSPEGQDVRGIPSHWIYGQAACLQALAEVQALISTPRIELAIRDAAAALMRAKNPYGCWRYSSPANGDSDISVTFWVMRALLSAEDAGVPIADGAAKHVMQFVNELTDGGTGRTGYTERGSPSSRVAEWGGHAHPPSSGETLTAEAVALRHWLGHGQDPGAKDGAELLLRRLPKWDPDREGVDYGYWLAGAEAMSQVGGKHWKIWSEGAPAALTESQITSGEGKGSWPPVGVWCAIGGRTYATATAVLTLQYFHE